jgi:hypothetical protein
MNWLTAQVRRVFSVEDTTIGSQKEGYLRVIAGA